MRNSLIVMLLLIVSILFLLPNMLLAYNGIEKIEGDSVDVIHYDLDFNLDPLNNWVNGTVEIIFASRINGLDEIYFNLGGDSLIIHSVMDGADLLNWTFHSNEYIEVDLITSLNIGEEDTIIIAFETDTYYDDHYGSTQNVISNVGNNIEQGNTGSNIGQFGADHVFS